ncbi:MAG: DUF2206 domain-containing protein [Candidatus Yonathbacteria bacterium]|nr:DUF2206 domain-containing protein [Candidatus Yonathbacteria bacterium]NTW47944.1 DUF2206 domain-containing protein [Candidatus Yonathbacteria bacterium]
MNPLTITRKHITIFLASWWTVFTVLLLANTHPTLLFLIGFPFLIIIPGYLATEGWNIRAIPFFARLALIVGLSLLSLLFTGLIVNAVWPMLGVIRPLDAGPFFSIFSLGMFIYGLYVYPRIRTYSLTTHTYPITTRARDIFFTFIPFLFVLTASIGAIRLNNGVPDTYTIPTLIGIALYILLLIREHTRREDMSNNITAIALYAISLSLLLMTSLRGWYVTGHDIQTESYVFALTKGEGQWIIDIFKNAYNACLSITILPTILSNLLRIPDPYIYKIAFQAIFAFVPPILFLTMRAYASGAIALLASAYFFAFPTFFSDMPSLNRQEIAFLFFSLMTYLMVVRELPLTLRRVLFTLFGLGVVVSHYSTTYIVIALLIFVSIFRALFFRLITTFRLHTRFPQAGIIPHTEHTKDIFVTKTMITILFLATFLWSSILTDTASGSITRVISKTFIAMRNATQEDTRSVDTFYSILSWKKPDITVSFASYERDVVEASRIDAPSGTYYEAYESTSIAPTGNTQSPLTKVGTFLADTGVDPSDTHYILRQSFGKIVQLLMLFGLLYTLWGSRGQERIFNADFVLLAIANVLLVASQVLLPVFSAEYGVLRAFQQALMVLGIFIVFGSMLVVMRNKRARIIVATSFLTLFFLAMSGVLTRIVLTTPPQLHLANIGTYHDFFYTRAHDIAAATWMDTHIPTGSTIQTDRPDMAVYRLLKDREYTPGIHPGIIQKDRYVLAGYANIHRGISLILWNGDIISYTYPLSFLDKHKDVLYNNGNVRVYK